MSVKTEAQILTDLADLKSRVGELERFMEEPLCVHFTKTEAGKRWTVPMMDLDKDSLDGTSIEVAPVAEVEEWMMKANNATTRALAAEAREQKLLATQTDLLKEMEQIEARENGLREAVLAWRERFRQSNQGWADEQLVEYIDAALAEKGKE